DDARVTPCPLLEARRDVVEQLLHDRALLNEGQRAPASGERSVLAERDHPLGEAASFLGLRIGGLDPLVLEQSRDQIAKQGASVRRGPVEFASGVQVTHQALSFSFCKRRRSSSSRLGN